MNIALQHVATLEQTVGTLRGELERASKHKEELISSHKHTLHLTTTKCHDLERQIHEIQQQAAAFKTAGTK